MRASFIQLFIVWLLLCSSDSSLAQTNNVQKKTVRQNIEAYIRKEMKAEQIPALTYAVVLNNKIIDSGAFGLANLELNCPASLHTKFGIGSIGKTFTATAIMLLQKEGKLSIDDPVNKYLDSLPETWKDITIRNLLTHTSGIIDYLSGFPGYPGIEETRDVATPEPTEAQFIKMVTSYPLNFKPGERWAYCNTNFVLLGFIVHRVSGKPLPEFMNEHVFRVLRMKETRYINVRELIPNRASGYGTYYHNQLSNGMYVGNFYSSQGDMGIITTAMDMAKWSIALNRGELLDKQILEQMWTPATLSNGMDAMGLVGGNYGFGWTIEDYRGCKLVGHSGSFGPGYTADFIHIPQKKLTVIVLTNLKPSNVTWISRNIAGFFFPELKGIDQLQPTTSNNITRTKKVYALLNAFAGDAISDSIATQSFKQRINPVTKALFQPSFISKMKLFYVGSDTIGNKSLVRYGAKIKNINYYRLQFPGGEHYLSVYFTKDNKIADVMGY